MTVQDIPEDSPSWGLSARIQLRVIAALIRREMRAHFGDSRMGYLWALLEPAMHLAVYMALFAYILQRRASLGTSTALFIMTGVIPYFMYSKVAAYVGGAIGGNRSLLTLPLVKPHDVIIARCMLEAATYYVVGFLTFLALFLHGIDEAVPHDLLSVLEATAIAIAMGTGVGMINIVIVSFIRNWMMLFGFISTPLWFLSCLWYLPEQVPEPLRYYLLYNPLVHVFLLFRMGFYRDFNPGLLDVPYAIAFATILVALGLALMNVARRRILAPQ
jgi:capsular polysaccharide transport system permease protein